MTVAEKSRLELQNLTGVRLSCQILCEDNMTVMAISRFMGTGLQGNKPAPELRPLPVEWTEK
jgi:hypothetical protein